MVFQHAEMFLESGGMFGNSARSALGRPDLDSWELFTRETLQNSWDARDITSNEDGVTFSIDYAELTGHRAEAFREYFGRQTLGLPALEELLRNGDSIPILTVSDSGTSGLQGPTAASGIQGQNRREDFVSFIRNIGRPSSKELKGGTYGFGKGVFFNMSLTDTVLVYTRTIDENYQPTSRFIAMANGESFTDNGDLYSGRHWWGEKAFGRTGNTYAEPVVGSAADALARTFLMDRHFTDTRPTGTSVAVIGPRVSDDGIEKTMQTIADSLTRWAWPHMVETVQGLDPIDFSISNNGAPVEIPDPETDPIISRFAEAYRTCLRHEEPATAKEFQRDFVSTGKRKWLDICSQRPIEYLGRLGVRTAPAERIPRQSILDGDFTHHVALMRGPRMVVTYLPGPIAEGDENYFAVFVASKQLDEIFAASEPPAHDEWNPKTVDLTDTRFFNPKTRKARNSNPVGIALKNIRESLNPRQLLGIDPEESKDVSRLTAIANNLGGIFSGATGRSARVIMKQPQNRSASSHSTSSNGVKTSVKLRSIVPSPEGRIAVFSVVVDSPSDVISQGLEIGIETAALVDGRKVTASEDGLELPTGLGWISSFGLGDTWMSVSDSLIGNENRLMRAPHWEGFYAVKQPRDTAITAEVVLSFDPEEK